MINYFHRQELVEALKKDLKHFLIPALHSEPNTTLNINILQKMIETTTYDMKSDPNYWLR